MMMDVFPPWHHGWIWIPMASMALGFWDGHQELCERIISEQRGLPETEVMGHGSTGGSLGLISARLGSGHGQV